jgi:hypothetical protein
MGAPSRDGNQEDFSVSTTFSSPPSPEENSSTSPAPSIACSSKRSSSSSRSSSASSASALYMQNMPLDLLACIASKLKDPTLLCLLSRTSRTLRIAASSDSAWASSFRQTWGRAIHRDVLASAQDAKLSLPGDNNDHGDGDGKDESLHGNTNDHGDGNEDDSLPHRNKGDHGDSDGNDEIPLSDPAEGRSDSDPDGSASDDVEAILCPAWILAPARCSAEANETLVLWLSIWRRNPCLKVAFGALDR